MIPPALPALLDPLVRDFLGTGAAGCRGTPAHLVFPQVFTANLAALRAPLATRGVAHRICYAHKVNRSPAFVREAARAGIGVDVASPGELDSALAAGVPPERIEATGPKDESFLRVLAAAGVTVNVDDLWELERLAAIAPVPVPVLLRLSGFAGTAPSRFGIPAPHLNRALALFTERITLRGLAFHLDTAADRDRLGAVAECLTLLESLWARGFAPSVLDIGGGLRQVFTADPGGYDAYTRALRDSLAGRGPRMTWGSATFGYRVADGAVYGTPVFHKYAATRPAPAALDELLTAPIPGHDRAFAELLADNLLELWLEPGKALVDHAGITVAGVRYTKELADGTLLVNVDLSRDTVTPADQEVLVDPLLLPTGPPPRPEPVGAFLAGRLCLERDMVSTRLVRLPFRPRPGDLLIFPNTAGYHSDLSAATAALHPLPPRFAVTRGPGGWAVVPEAGHRPAEEGSCRPASPSTSPT